MNSAELFEALVDTRADWHSLCAELFGLLTNEQKADLVSKYLDDTVFIPEEE